ncbi:anti-sigma factor antagonist [Mucilaginibacter limnophilus]|uniref:Anti-sigma factor antagonist n=1 Tax=Mucilaginibacter limnophilus TaxID=1932778 RepID=A0A3S2VAC8_9SPHI|nr:STAS domain-containing protein [Mucilaginibacter limnophilus]RVU02714.1 anti-sigma factor antagonist [Mucilaginibacter limnophilus]
MIDIQEERPDYLLAKVNLMEANLNNADKFRDELVNLLNKYGKRVVLDLSKITYMDSSFLGALVSALKHAIANSSDVILIHLKKDIHDLFALIRLDKVFKIHKNLEAFTTAG